MFCPHTGQDRRKMLNEIGVSSLKELLAQVPSDLLYPKLNLPPALTEPELSSEMARLSEKNGKLLNFAGAGAYEHFIPAAVRAITSRGEFVTAYTPYQAEASQGALQAMYEYQSSVCALFELEVSNASLYDGATALAEAVGAAFRITGRKKAVLPQALHPHYKKTLAAYYSLNPSVSFAYISCSGGTLDLAALEKEAADSACVVLAQPNFFGCLEDAEAVSAIAKKTGALLVSVVNPMSLGVISPPGSYGADIAVAEGQPLGIPLSYGGPYLGMFACKKEHIRQVPGRICGMAKDRDGKRAFVLTLQAREQHIRRQKAASNICSNEALCAIYAAVYLALLGPEGIKEVGELNLEAAHNAAKEISGLKGYSLKFNAPFFNEFAVSCPRPAREIAEAAAKEGILAGYPLDEFGLENCLLVCATETKTPADIKKLVSVLEKCSHG